MKFTKPLLYSSLLMALASPMVFAGDDAAGTGEVLPTNGTLIGDTQLITITVPEVSLIDVTNAVTAILVPPTNAGDNFTEVLSTGSPNYDISANVLEGTSQTRKIVATPATIPSDWEITFNMSAPSVTGTSVGDVSFGFADIGSTIDLVTGISNVAEKDIPLTVKIGPENPNKMPSYTAGGGKILAVVYTITADL